MGDPFRKPKNSFAATPHGRVAEHRFFMPYELSSFLAGYEVHPGLCSRRLCDRLVEEAKEDDRGLGHYSQFIPQVRSNIS